MHRVALLRFVRGHPSQPLEAGPMLLFVQPALDGSTRPRRLFPNFRALKRPLEQGLQCAQARAPVRTLRTRLVRGDDQVPACCEPRPREARQAPRGRRTENRCKVLHGNAKSHLRRDLVHVLTPGARTSHRAEPQDRGRDGPGPRDLQVPGRWVRIGHGASVPKDHHVAGGEADRQRVAGTIDWAWV